MKHYTREEAKEKYENISHWTDEDFLIAESNWDELGYNSDEAVEPYSSCFLEWCSEHSV